MIEPARNNGAYHSCSSFVIPMARPKRQGKKSSVIGIGT